MQYRTMESTGDGLSALGFGCMRLPENRGRIDEDRARAQIISAIEAGVNYLDTAVPYHMGASEGFLGRLLADGYRDRVKLATKLPHWSVKSRADMDRMLQAQLSRLQTDCIDYYLIHNIGINEWKRLLPLGVEDFLRQARQSWRVKHLGFSSHASTTDFTAVVTPSTGSSPRSSTATSTDRIRRAPTASPTPLPRASASWSWSHCAAETSPRAFHRRSRRSGTRRRPSAPLPSGRYAGSGMIRA